MTKTFRDLGVDGALCDALATEGITHPFPIQELTLPLALGGNDLIGQARTGTGKTLAFGLPLLQRLDPSKKVTQALVIVPTRELCLQVFDDLKIGAARDLTSIAVYGGVGFEEQIEALRGGAHVVVGTPGRLLDHLNRRNLDLSQVTQLVLDEADEMLDMGFLPDVERLVEACTGDDRHTMLFSATMPTAIVKLARRYMHHPTFTRADTEQHETAPNVAQHFLQVHRMDKPRVLARILQSPERGGVYVFVRTKHMADRLVNELEDLGVAAIPIHGDLRQTSREKNLDRFRSGKATVLVATEVAARGLDVGGVTHVVNYDCPDDEKMYLHRIGRTARAGEAGVAVTFAEFNEVDKLNVIRKRVGATDTPVEQVFSTSDALKERFGLPDERPWDRLASTKDRPDDRRPDRSAGGRRGERTDRDRGGRDRSDKDRSQAPRAERQRQDRDGEVARERAGSGGRRRGQSDGRPKSERRTEGSGGDHDARRDRERSSREGSDSTSQSSKSSPSGGGRTRTRTRSRATSGRSGGSDSAQRSTTSTTTGESDGGATSDAKGDQPQPRKRARTSRSTAKPDGAKATRERSNGEQDRRGARSESARGSRSSESSGRSGDSRKASRGQKNSSDRSARSSSGGSAERGRRKNGADKRTQPVEVQRRGRAARGEGQPQPSRRVKVEHLP